MKMGANGKSSNAKSMRDEMNWRTVARWRTVSTSVSPLRLLVDVNGKELSGALPHDRLNDLCSNIRRRTAQAIVPQIRPEVETMVDHVERLSKPHLEPLKAQALDQLAASFEPEIRRLEALQRVNPAIREEEIDYFRGQFEAARDAIGHASLALEGIRVIVTA